MSALENIANPQPEDDAVQRQIWANLGIADPQATPQAPESQNSSARAVADMGVGVLSGGLGALQSVAGLASMVPVVDLAAAPIDRGLGAAREWLGDTLYSDTAKQQQQRMQQAIESSDGGVLEKYGKGFSELGLHGGAAMLGEALGTMGGLGKATQLANSARLAAKGLTAEQQAARLKAMTPAARRAEEIKEVAGASAAFGAGIGASRVNAQQDETQGYLSNLSDRWAAAIPNALVYGVTAGLGSKLLGPLDPQTAVNRMMGAGMEGAEVSKLVAAVMNKDWYVRGAFGMGVSMADQTTQMAIQSYSDKASENFGLSQNKWADVKSGKVWEGALDSAASGAVMGTLGGVVGAKAALRPRVDLSGGKGGKGGELQGDTQPAPAPGPRPPAPDIVESVLGDMRSSIRESARGVIERNNITDDFADISNVRNLFNALTDPQNSKHTDYSLMAHLFDVAFSADKGDNSRAQAKRILTTLFGEAKGTRKHGTQITDIFDGIAGELNGYQKTHAAAKLLETLLGRSAESRTKSEDALSEAQNEAHAASDIDAARDKLNKAQQEHIMQERMHDALRSVFQDALNKKSSADNTRSEGARKYNEAERAANMDGAEQSRTVANAFLESAFKFLSPRDAAQGESVDLIDAAGKNGEQGHQHIFESFASKLAELYGFYGEKQLQYVFEKLLAMPVGNEPYSNGNSAVFRQAVEQVMFPHMRLGGYQLPVLDATGRIPVEKINELKAKLEERQSASDNMLKGNAKKTAQSSLDALSTFVDAMEEINNRVDEFEAAEAANAQGNRSGFSQFAENARPYEDARAAPTIQAIREAKKAERLRDVDATINSAMTKHEQEQEAAARAAQQERAYLEARDAAAAKLEANGGKLYPGEVPVTPWEHSRAKTGAEAQAELDNIASADRDIQAVEQAKVDRENKTKDWKLRAGRQQQIEETLQSDKEIDARFRKIKGWNVLANELGVDVKGKSIKDVRAAVREYLGADGGFEKLREIAKAQKKTESTTQSQIGSDGLRFSQIAQENIAGYRDGTRPDPATSADTAAHLTGRPPRTPMTKIREAIQRMYGSLLDKLEAAGRVTLTQTLEEALDAAAEARARMTGQTIEQARREVLDTLRMQEAGRIEGFYDPHTMRTYLVADNLSVETAGGTLMHEVGVHMAKDMSSGMAEIVAQARAFVQNNKSNPFVQRALKRMTEAKETSGEEFLAYIVTEYENNRAKMPSSLVQMVQDFVATVRAWLHQHGWVDTGSLTAADLAAIARANARELSEAPQQQLRWSKQARQEFAQTETSLGGQDAYRQARERGKTVLNYRQWVQTRTPSFKRWFGDWETNPQAASKAVHPRTGEPLMLYHGTSGNFSWFNTLAGKTSSFNGAFLTDNPLIGATYAGGEGGNMMQLYANLKNPLVIDAGGRNWNALDGAVVRYPDGTTRDLLEVVGDRIIEVGGEKYVDEAMLSTDAVVDFVKNAGAHDGVIFDNIIDMGESEFGKVPGTVLAALDSSQVKSATGNTGEFNKRSGDIRHSLAQSDVLAPVEPTLNIPGQLRTAANFLRTKLNFVPGLIENLQRRLPSMRSYTTAIERQANLVAPWLRMHDDLGQRLTKLPLSSRDKIAEALVKYSETGVLPDIAPSAQIMSFTQTPGVGVTEAWHPVQQAAPGQPVGPGQAVINNLPLQGLSQVEVDMVLHIVDAMAQIQMKDTEARIRQFKEVFAELRNAAQTNPNIQNVDQMEAKAYAALAALHNERISRGYVPQQRNGKYQVFVKSQQYATEEMNDPNRSSPTLAAMRSPDLNHYIYSAVDSQADAESLVAQYKQQYPNHVVEMKLKPLTDVELGMNMHNLLQMYRRAQTQLTGNQADTILSNQLVESLAQSISKYVRDSDTVNNARMARENIKGLLLSEVLNGVMTRTRSFGDYYGAVMTASDRFDALKKMRIELDRLTGPENTKYTSLYNEFLKLATEVKGEETLGDKVTSKLLGWTAFNYLITNPSFFVLQLAQPFVVSAPVMMGEFGTKGMTQLTNAYKLMGAELLKDMKNNSIQLEFNFLLNNNNLPHARQVMNSKIRDALLDLQARKLLDVGLNQETGFAQNATQNMLGKLPHWLSNIARGVEVINRSTTGAAAYELKMIQLLKGQSITTISQAQMGSYHKQALNYAASIILHTHGDYSHDAAPQIFRSNVGKVALQFKKIGLVFGGLIAKLFTNAVRGPDVSGDAKALFQRLTDPVFGRTPDEIAILNQMAKQKTYFGNISDAQLVTLRRALEQVLTSTGQAGKLNPEQYELLGQVLAAELNPESFITTEKQAAAAKSLAYLLGVSGMAVGAMGIPMLTTILAMIGRAVDSDEDKERYANETDDATIQRKYGPGVARGLAASLAGVDISQRIGINFTDQLLGGFYNNAQFGKGQDNVKSALLSIGGPAFSLVQDYVKSLEYFNRYSTSESPHDLLKALAYASPLGARNMLLSNLYSREGLVNDAGQTLIDKKDMPNAALKKFFGFQPDEIASFYDMRTNRDQIQAAVNQKRTMLKRAFKEAIDADDADRRQEVVDMWRELQQNQIKVGIVPSNIKELVEYAKAQYKRDALSVGGMTTTTKNRALTQDVADYYDR